MQKTLSLSTVIRPKPGWYRGDFHAHTTFSDGYYAPLELIDAARDAGLDFLSITDHNTIDALSSFEPPTDILIIPGLEVTFKEGHYNVFGIEGYADWMEHICAEPHKPMLAGQYNTLTKLMQQASSEGLLNSINHPLLAPWAWLDKTTDLRNLHCLEIWNDPGWADNAQANPKAVEMWTHWLNAGYRITAIGGTDYHQPHFKPGYTEPQRLGIPSTYVYAEQLSGEAILEGVRQRRVYVSKGPQVTFQAHFKDTTYDIGADLGEVEGTVEFTTMVSHSSTPVKAQLVKNGEVIRETPLENGQGEFRSADNADPSQPFWYRFEVLSQDDEILTLTNPIFTGPRREPVLWQYGDFVSG